MIFSTKAIQRGLYKKKMLNELWATEGGREVRLCAEIYKLDDEHLDDV